MLETVELVAKAVADRDISPILKYVCLQGGRLQGGDSRVCVDAPLVLPELEGLCIDADKLVLGTRLAKGKPVLRLKEGRLELKRASGWTLANVRGADEYPRVAPPQGPPMGRIALEPLKRVKTFISENAVHAWSVGVLLRDGYAYATNGVSFVARTPIDYVGADVCLPVYCVDKLLQLPFTHYEAHDGGDKGLYLVAGDVWVRTTAITLAWPQGIASMFDGFPAELPAFPAQDLRAALDAVVPCVVDTKDKRLVLRDGMLRVQADDAAEAVALPDGSWRAEILELLVAHATNADLSKWPLMCPWYGSGMQGFAMGVRA